MSLLCSAVQWRRRQRQQNQGNDSLALQWLTTGVRDLVACHASEHNMARHVCTLHIYMCMLMYMYVRLYIWMKIDRIAAARTYICINGFLCLGANKPICILQSCKAAKGHNIKQGFESRDFVVFVLHWMLKECVWLWHWCLTFNWSKTMGREEGKSFGWECT